MCVCGGGGGMGRGRKEKIMIVLISPLIWSYEFRQLFHGCVYTLVAFIINGPAYDNT